MLTTLAVANYRSINQLIVPLARLNLITGPNGSGKSNLYRALRLLAETAQGGVVNALAREGGLESTFWAGPEVVSRRMKSGEVAIEGGPRNKVKRLRMGFAAEDFSYAIALGVSPPERSAFTLDPQIKHESIWVGPSYRPASELVERNGPMIRARTELRRHMLANFKNLPVAGEYMHRDIFDIAEVYGKDTFVMIDKLGTDKMPMFFTLKGRMDAIFGKVPFLPSHLVDRTMQTLSHLLPSRARLR